MMPSPKPDDFRSPKLSQDQEIPDFLTEPELKDIDDEVEEFDDSIYRKKKPTHRGATNDPLFGYIIALALSIGLSPLVPSATDMRYTLLWGLLAGFGVLAWWAGSGTRIEQEQPDDLAWGIIFGLIIGVPLLAVGGSTLTTTVKLLFVEMKPGTLLAYLLFAMPLAETLFFRGLLQANQPFWLVGLLSSVWSLLIFLPMLDISQYPVVGIVIGTALLMMNIIYSYVRTRNGLAAAWLCQITVNIVVLFLPILGSS